ncbi:hypothetical protein HKK70_08710 [Bacillus safensis]|uniref:hypothetical protein n=1 Tax=Bacillus safensis TaxID=561879 RepID=UPI00146C4B20|nr:hypothetical protein [Bacillus safensis]MCM3366024.1 hypothetical protein [Bacillus safensis]NMW01845.1 hypothetical protein [Bacillus safensis]
MDRKILEALIQIYQNDFMCGYQGDDKDKLRVVFLELIVHTTRYINDFRYCNKEGCPCSPEHDLTKMIDAHQEDIFLKMIGDYALSDYPSKKVKDFLFQFKTKENQNEKEIEEEA